MKRVVLLIGLVLVPGVLWSCSEADRDAMFSTQRAPLVGACDPQPGYPPPSQRPGCEYIQGGPGGRMK
ncbi:MAG TPA: hypothetical protein VMB81_11570 [Candidatus Sulfotelmatobacter sp.]|nr:hypothetical protein [Candidatus Sulfotelmatobacter sp.]